ncbi:MAG TPA: tetratricopeptide repeat protein [Abditibacteriaceae bacterium]|jgi:tetratricopeptide (TPR) repeat protein
MPIYLKRSLSCLLVPVLALALSAPSSAQDASDDEAPAPDETTAPTDASATGAAATSAAVTSATPAKQAIVEPIIKEGELRVDGVVKMIASSNSFTIDVQSFTTSKGKTVELSEAKPKTITSEGTTSFYARGDAATKLAFSDIKLGMRLSIVGKDMGSGKALPAREITLWVERNRDSKSLGTVRVEHEVGKLIDRGDEARQVRDLNSALRFYNRAIEQAVGSGDRSGQALALGRAADIHGDMEQLDEALNLLNRSLSLWRALGNTQSEATALNNIAIIYGKQDQNEQAIESFERAVALLQNGGNKKAIVLTWSNLAGAYMQADQFDKARHALEQVLPMVRGGADKGAEAEILSELAYVAARSDDTQQAQNYLQQVVPMLDAIGDKEIRGRTLHNVALAYHSTGETEQALDYYKQTLVWAQGLGDRQLEQSAQKGITTIQTPGQAQNGGGANE